MTIYALIREDQSEHGFVDTGVVGLFRNQKRAKAVLKSSVAEARQQGLRICGDPEADRDWDWDVCWMIEEHSLV